LLIETYFEQIRDLIAGCKVISYCDLETENRGLHEGFIRAKIDFTDNSVLHIREFVTVEIMIDRKYV
jgi:hypothetical protein